MSCRYLLEIAFVASLAAAPVLGEPVLTLKDALDRAFGTGEIDARRMQVDEARANARAARIRPNPTLTYDRQDMFDEGVAPGFVQDLVKVEQALPGRKLRTARRALGAREIARAEAEVLVQRRKRELEVRRAFVRALAAQAELGAYAQILERVRGLGSVISARVSAGESSNYEKARIALAEAQEQDAEDAADVEHARRRAELAAAIGVPLGQGTRLAGALVTAVPSDRAVDDRVDAALAVLDAVEREATAAGGGPATAYAARPELIELQTRMAIAAAAGQVARAEARPYLTVGAGYMHFDQTGLPDQSGYNAVAAVVLPLPERRAAETDAARARREAARLELLATVRRIRGEITGARESVRAATRRLSRLTRTEKSQLDPLIEMARTSYQAGLQSLLELLDAYRLEREFTVQRVRAGGVLTEALEELALAVGVDASVWTAAGAAAIETRIQPEGE